MTFLLTNSIKKIILPQNIIIYSIFFLSSCTSVSSSYTPSSSSRSPSVSNSLSDAIDWEAELSENWIADKNTGCYIYNPKPQQNDTVTWSGDCESGYANGVGTVRWYVNGIFHSGDTGHKTHGKYDNSVTVITYNKDGNKSGEHKYSSTGQYLGEVNARKNKKTATSTSKNCSNRKTLANTYTGLVTGLNLLMGGS